MQGRLPTELSVSIIETAAHQYRLSGRQSVVNLAMCCRAVYEIVAPILYHTLVVTQSNADRLTFLVSSRATHSLAERMLSHVRSFHDFSRMGHHFHSHSLANVENFDSPEWSFFTHWQPFDTSDFIKLKSVCIREVDFAQTVASLSPVALQAVTHITGLLPVWNKHDWWFPFFVDPARWIQSLLESLPAVTHLGLMHDYPWSFNGPTARFDYEAVGTALRAALRDYPQLQCIAIRVTGADARRCRTELEMIVRDVRDPRIKLWFDSRRYAGWDEHLALCALDVEEGRNIWTEARPL